MAHFMGQTVMLEQQVWKALSLVVRYASKVPESITAIATT